MVSGEGFCSVFFVYDDFYFFFVNFVFFKFSYVVGDVIDDFYFYVFCFFFEDFFKVFFDLVGYYLFVGLGEVGGCFYCVEILLFFFVLEWDVYKFFVWLWDFIFFVGFFYYF